MEEIKLSWILCDEKCTIDDTDVNERNIWNVILNNNNIRARSWTLRFPQNYEAKIGHDVKSGEKL